MHLRKKDISAEYRLKHETCMCNSACVYTYLGKWGEVEGQNMIEQGHLIKDQPKAEMEEGNVDRCVI